MVSFFLDNHVVIIAGTLLLLKMIDLYVEYRVKKETRDDWFEILIRHKIRNKLSL